METDEPPPEQAERAIAINKPTNNIFFILVFSGFEFPSPDDPKKKKFPFFRMQSLLRLPPK